MKGLYFSKHYSRHENWGKIKQAVHAITPNVGNGMIKGKGVVYPLELAQQYSIHE